MPNWTPNSSADGNWQAGIVAERDLQLPPRDSRVTEKNQAKKNEASNKAAHDGNPAANTTDAFITSGDAAARTTL